MEKKKRKHSKLERQHVGFYFIILWLIGFLVFKLYPFATSFVQSFTDYHMFKGTSKVGLMNYKQIFTERKRSFLI